MSEDAIKIPKRIGWGEGGGNLPELNRVLNELDELMSELKIPMDTPVAAKAATGILTVEGVVIDGETIEIGDDTYEFAADDAQTVAPGNIPVDITSYTTKAEGTLTMAAQPSVGDTITIGDVTYTWVTANPGEGEIAIGVDVAEAQANFVDAVNGVDGVNPANPYVTAGDFISDDCILTAIIGGAVGNSINTDETLTNESDGFDAASLGTTTAGIDCSAANAIIALVAASASGTEDVTITDGDGNTVNVTCNTKGVIGNAILTSTDMENASFGGEHLDGGVDGTISPKGGIVFDATNLYVAVDECTTSVSNWKKIAFDTLT